MQNIMQKIFRGKPDALASPETLNRKRFEIGPWLKQNWLLILILLAGFYLRVENIYSVRFSAEQDAFLIPCLKLLTTHQLPLLGVETSGLIDAKMGPLLTYLYVLPLLISRNPISIIIFSAIMDIVGVILCYLLVRDLLNKRAALISAALVSVNPLLIYLCRNISNLSVLFFFIMLFFWSCYWFFMKGKSAMLILILIALGCLLQIHILSGILVITCLVYYLVYKPKFRMKHLIMGIVGILILFSTFIYYEATHGFENTLGTLKLFTTSMGISASSKPISIILRDYVFFNTHLDLMRYDPLFVMANSAKRIPFDFLSRIEEIVFLVAVSLILVMIIISLIKKSRSFLNKREIAKLMTEKYYFLFIWMLIPLLFFIFFKIKLEERYYIFLFPVPLIIIGGFLDFIMSLDFPKKPGVKKIVNRGICLAVGLFFVVSVIFIPDLHKVSIKESSIFNELPLKAKLELVSFAMQNLSINNDIFLEKVHLVGLEENLMDGFYYLFEYLSPKNGMMITRDEKSHYLIMRYETALKFFREGINYDAEYMIDNLVILKYTSPIDYSKWELISNPAPEWFQQNYSNQQKTHIQFPFKKGNRTMAELFIKGDVQIKNKTQSLIFVLVTRTCIEKFYVNDKLVVNQNCTRGWRLNEISPFRYEINLTEWVQDGDNTIAMKLVNIDKSFSVEAFDISFNEKKESLEKIALIDGFENSKIPDYYLSLSKDSQGSFSIVDSPAGSVSANKALEIEYLFLGDKPYAMFYRPFPYGEDWTNYSAISFLIKGSGSPDFIKFVITDFDGDQWVYENFEVLKKTDWTEASVKLADLYNPDWATHGNGQKDFDKITSYQLHITPFEDIIRTQKNSNLSTIYIQDIYLNRPLNANADVNQT